MGALLAGALAKSFGTIKSQRAGNGKQSGYVAGMVLIFDGGVLPEKPGKALTRRQPELQAEGEEGDGSDPAEPKRNKPQQALRQRPRVLRLAHQ
jgi:hypothetical protein